MVVFHKTRTILPKFSLWLEIRKLLLPLRQETNFVPLLCAGGIIFGGAFGVTEGERSDANCRVANQDL